MHYWWNTCGQYMFKFFLTPGVTNIWQITTIKDKKCCFIKIVNGISFIQIGAMKEVITTTQSKIIETNDTK